MRKSDYSYGKYALLEAEYPYKTPQEKTCIYYRDHTAYPVIWYDQFIKLDTYGSVVCSESGVDKCAHCGWNPLVAAKRKARVAAGKPAIGKEKK